MLGSSSHSVNKAGWVLRNAQYRARAGHLTDVTA
jgi:hypothetical protein